MTKKITSIIYRYDDGSVEYVDSVSEISATSLISFCWFNATLTKLKNYWNKTDDETEEKTKL